MKFNNLSSFNVTQFDDKFICSNMVSVAKFCWEMRNEDEYQTKPTKSSYSLYENLKLAINQMKLSSKFKTTQEDFQIIE